MAEDIPTARFRYHGPTVRVVALDREIENGEEFEGPVELEANFGFERIEEKRSRRSNSGDDE